MSEFLNQLVPYLPALITTAGAVAAAICGVVIAWSKKTTAQHELEVEKTQLEKDKVELERTIYEGSYIICPQCGRKIILKEMEFHIDR